MDFSHAVSKTYERRNVIEIRGLHLLSAIEIICEEGWPSLLCHNTKGDIDEVDVGFLEGRALNAKQELNVSVL